MSSLHIRQIRSHLQSKLVGLLDVSDVTAGSAEQTESAQLTRALAAFSLTALAEAGPQDAADAVTDGFQDNGIDAIYHDRNSKVLYLVQSKWSNSGTTTISKGDVAKFADGINDLINARFERFNERITARRAEIDQALNDATTRFVLLLIYTGEQAPATEAVTPVDDILTDLNDPVEIVSLQVMRQADIYALISQGASGTPIDEDLVLYDWGQNREPYQAYYGQIAASDIADLWDKHYPRLFAPNIRLFLGTTDVNTSLADTLRTAPENFWYFNNGITALCSDVRKKPQGGNRRDSGVFECHGLQIVNGAQTAGCIGTAAHTHPDEVAKARVPIRLISLATCPTDFAKEVTRCNNTQNRIERRDFVALDPQQERLRSELQLEGISYAYKAGESVPRDRGFDLSEATAAMAVAQQDVQYAVQAKREIGRLWEDISQPPYTVLFNGGLAGPVLWRAVQSVRAVEKALARIRGERSGREGLLAVHGNRFIQHLIVTTELQAMDIPEGSLSSETSDAIAASSEEVYQRVLSVLDREYPDSYLASLFKNLTKCRHVKELVRSNVGAAHG